MNHETLASELVRALRGKRSQGAVNRRLGHTSNVLHTWERGTRAPGLGDFLRLARLAGVSVTRVLAEFATLPRSDERAALAVGDDARAWLGILASRLPRSELARKLGRSRNTIARWLDGDTEPRLPDLLRLVEVTTQRLVDFVAAFVDPRALPSLRATFEDLQLQRRLAYEMPWTHAVLRLLELEQYRALPTHVHGFIAERIGISTAEEEACLEALARSGQIRRKSGKWRVRRVLAVDTRLDPEANWRLKKHWAAVGLERMDQKSAREQGLFSYNLFAISDEGLEEIRNAHLQYYERVRSIVAECRHPTRLALVNVELLPLDG